MCVCVVCGRLCVLLVCDVGLSWFGSVWFVVCCCAVLCLFDGVCVCVFGCVFVCVVVWLCGCLVVRLVGWLCV